MSPTGPPEGGGLAPGQADQARAAGVGPHVDMNPVLLKPSSQTGSQVIVLGRPVRHMAVREYHAYQPEVWPTVTAAYDRLRVITTELKRVVAEGGDGVLHVERRSIAGARLAALLRWI